MYFLFFFFLSLGLLIFVAQLFKHYSEYAEVSIYVSALCCF